MAVVRSRGRMVSMARWALIVASALMLAAAPGAQAAAPPRIGKPRPAPPRLAAPSVTAMRSPRAPDS